MSAAAVAEKPPVVRRGFKRKSEFDSRSVEPGQKPSISMPPIDQPFERTPDIIVVENDLDKDEAIRLAFAEDPMRIIIHRSGEKFSPKTTDLIAVNGIKAEMLVEGVTGWVQIGYLPRGVALWTKRKYVEQIAHSKVNHINTVVIKHENHEENNIDPVTIASYGFSVLRDDNPAGIPWLESILRMNG